MPSKTILSQDVKTLVYVYKSEKYNVHVCVAGDQTKSGLLKPSNQVTKVLESGRTFCCCY